MTEAANAQQLAKAISDANEVRLAHGALGVAPATRSREPLRVGVPEVTNKTTQTVDTRALSSRLVAELEEQKIDVMPMAAAPPAALDARANELGVDYLLIAEVTDLKASKPGGLTKIMKNTAGEGSGKDITEAKLNVQLVPPGGKPRLTKIHQRQGRRRWFQDRARPREVCRLALSQDVYGRHVRQPAHGLEHDEDHEHRRDGQSGADANAGRPWPAHRRIGRRSHGRCGDVRHAAGDGRAAAGSRTARRSTPRSTRRFRMPARKSSSREEGGGGQEIGIGIQGEGSAAPGRGPARLTPLAVIVDRKGRRGAARAPWSMSGRTSRWT